MYNSVVAAKAFSLSIITGGKKRAPVLCRGERLNEKRAQKGAKHNADMSPSPRLQSIVRGNAIFNEIKVALLKQFTKLSKSDVLLYAAANTKTVTLSELFRMETLLRFCISGITEIRPLVTQSARKNYKCIFRVLLICWSSHVPLLPIFQ